MLHHEPLDRVFHALADPGRRSMVERLSRGPASVSDLAEPLDMTLTAVVQHVRVLEASGLVTSAKRGRVRTCRLHAPTLRAAEAWILDRRRQWERRLDRLGDVLGNPPDHPEEPPT
ncbi:MAG TPA: metalloregulator ArsR/SmtB family transcription factor [Acidimicrobiales bacterium]|jgi:DNA-binding transcriptional ArsR family regulator|nr:metalloregulator ArsR/SmtB family transcription factor [Acidimicrobiales bacterium]